MLYSPIIAKSQKKIEKSLVCNIFSNVFSFWKGTAITTPAIVLENQNTEFFEREPFTVEKSKTHCPWETK